MAKKKQKPVEIVEESDEVEEVDESNDGVLRTLAESLFNLTEVLYEKYEH